MGMRRTATLATGGKLFHDALLRSPGATILTDTRYFFVPLWLLCTCFSLLLGEN